MWTICWYNFEELQMLGQILEGMKSKNVSQNSKIMFRTKITAKSVSHSNCFSPLHQKKAYNFGTKPLKRNLWYSLLDRISNFRYAKYYLILSRNVTAEDFQALLNLKVSKTRNQSLYCWNLIYLEFLSRKNDNLATSILQPIVKAVLDRQHPRKSKTPFS